MSKDKNTTERLKKGFIKPLIIRTKPPKDKDKDTTPKKD